MKILLLAFKDLTVIFRDRAALILMLAAPLALTLGLGLVTGRFAGNTAGGLSQIPVLIVNADTGQLGEALVQTFQSDMLADLVAPRVLTDEVAARTQVEADQVAALVVIPAGFTDSIMQTANPVVTVEVYVNPARPTSAGVVQTIVESFLSQVEVGRVGGTVAVTQLLDSRRITPQQAGQVGATFGAQQADARPPITLVSEAATSTIATFDPLAYMAPGMALLFLMYTVSHGGYVFLREKTQGTWPRLLITPTLLPQLLAGKLLGTYLTGVAQMSILIAASGLLFQVSWGDLWGVAALVLSVAAAATGWGAMLTAVARTPSQVASLGSALMLTFGILGGSFVGPEMMPAWVSALGRITPNAWGVEAFASLALGNSITTILPQLGALWLMAGVLFAAASFVFPQRHLRA